MQKSTKPSAEEHESAIAFFGGAYVVILTALVTAILITVVLPAPVDPTKAIFCPGFA